MTETAQTPATAAAPSKAKKGKLRVERVYTAPGTHPYDEVQWERRDVVMTNWRDGSINFEQRGVEFPDFWSVNAANIVTTKYFRGAVGHDNREWSLKQLIDRVVQKYVAAGREFEYFQNESDSEAFEHELTYMLLHQIFSFNSPVWFNVGTTAPQQVSACQPYDALVSTPEGLIPIGQLVEQNAVGTKVYDADGLTKVLAVKDNGLKEVLRLVTKAGYVLDVTADHLVWKSTGEGTGGFVPAGTLEPGDQLEWHRRDAFGEREIDVQEIHEAALWGGSADGVDAVVPPSLFSAPLPVLVAYLRNIFEADGYVSAGEPSAFVALDMVSEELVRGIQSLLLRFGVFSRVSRKNDPRENRLGTWTLRIQNEGDRDLFENGIGFVSEEKQRKLAASFELEGRPAKETKRLEIARIESRGEMNVYDIQTESGEYLSGNLRVHNCFILAVDDSMDSILNWYKEEGKIFQGGSGAGLNLSRIRSSKELLSSGGTASGPVSFMRGADASAGTIKSGGATRRAAKMVVLDVDHPDIEEFIDTKAREEDKIRALRDAGFDMDLGGKDIVSVQYQNANNSVRVSDEFMRAVEGGTEFGLRARRTGEVIETIDARKLWNKLATAAWECADPGIQYDDTINDWHTNPESGRITASNPCFPADQRVVTDKGLVRIGDLVGRAALGETFAVYTNDITSETESIDRIEANSPVQYMVTGTKEVLELRFTDGSRLRCTPNHRLWTTKGWVRAEDLTDGDGVVKSLHLADRSAASQAIPESALESARAARSLKELTLPEKWDAEFAHYLGWIVGDGCLTQDAAVTVYGSEEDRTTLLERHLDVIEQITGHRSKPSVQANGTQQLRVTRDGVLAFLGGLGVSAGRSATKVVPESIYQAPQDALAAFLRGLFDADGCVVDQEAKGNRYVGLGSRSEELVLGVQELLASLGIHARIYTAAPKVDSFSYTRKDGSTVSYSSDGPSYDLRITGGGIARFQSLVGFTLPSKAAKLAHVVDSYSVYDVDQSIRMVSRVSTGFETTYNLTEPRNHSYIVSGIVVANCSEYMSLDNSSCNLASLNLMKFLRDDGTFDAKLFASAVEVVITAMDISICFADFPTEPIGDTTRNFRQLGIGYANLGALLMATGHAYDSEGGRTLAAAITSLMTGTAYKRSAELAGVVGPYNGYAQNASAHQRVMRKHAAANDAVRVVGADDARVLHEATKAWQECLAIGEKNGWRNAQASVIAPTGCLTADTLVTTDRGLSRLEELGDLYGDKWQGVDFQVSTDEGPRQATKFFVNGEEPTRRIVTEGGYRIQGTYGHRIKVIQADGTWEWKRLMDVAAGDVVPVQLDTLVGEPRRVPLPVLDQAYYTGDHRIVVPDAVDEDLAELVGYFMGDGSLHAKGIRFCVADTDLDVVERLRILGKQLFSVEAEVTAQQGYQEVVLTSVRLARWWEAAGFAKQLPQADHSGKGWTPHVPAAIRETNSKDVYAAFLRGLFEADGTVANGVPSVSTSSRSFASEVQVLLLTLALPSTVRETVSGFGGEQFQVRLRNLEHAVMYGDVVGFLSDRKARLVAVADDVAQTGNRDRVLLPAAVWDELVPVGHALRDEVLQNLRRAGGVPRSTAEGLYRETRDDRLKHALDYVFEVVAANEDGGIQPTYDLSVPDNVTYVAGGFVSHNTIGLMMDCDTTGLEPDLALVKFKKLVGGGSMQIVNQTVPRALRSLGYQEEQVEAIVEFIAEHGNVVGAPGLKTEHYEVFDCAMGERSISAMGHVRLMAAIQPFVSGALSKTVNLPAEATVDDVADVYFQGWKLGLKALAIYRNNSKVGQPLQSKKDSEKKADVEEVGELARLTRKRLPKRRTSKTTSFAVAGAEGYMTAGEYEDGTVGEVFIKMSKQGSTLAGVMDAFSISISIGLQYGVPLEAFVSKYINMRFDPAGLTDDADVRMAQSVMDYLFRRLALDYLPYDVRSEFGIFTAEERAATVSASYGAAPAVADDVDVEGLAQGVPTETAVHVDSPKVGSSTELLEALQGTSADAPLCMTCGTKMRPAGSCYVCEGCGSTSGCS